MTGNIINASKTRASASEQILGEHKLVDMLKQAVTGQKLANALNKDPGLPPLPTIPFFKQPSVQTPPISIPDGKWHSIPGSSSPEPASDDTKLASPTKTKKQWESEIAQAGVKISKNDYILDMDPPISTRYGDGKTSTGKKFDVEISEQSGRSSVKVRAELGTSPGQSNQVEVAVNENGNVSLTKNGKTESVAGPLTFQKDGNGTSVLLNGKKLL